MAFLNFFLTVTLLISAASAANDQLRCLNCNPIVEGHCLDTNKMAENKCVDIAIGANLTAFEKALVSIQKDDVADKYDTDIFDYQCFALHLKTLDSNDLQNGVYRGCFKSKANIVDLCNFIKEESPKDFGEVSVCEACATDSCNNKKIEPNGGATNAISIFIVLFNLFVVLYVSDV